MSTQRLTNLQKNLAANKIDALLVSSAVNIRYLTGFTSLSNTEREAFLFVTPTSATFFTNPLYFEAVKKMMPPKIKVVMKPVSEAINQIISAKGGSASSRKSIGFEENLTFAEYKRLSKNINAKLVLTEDLVESLREIKDEEEIKALRHAAKVTDDTFEFIKPLIKIGVTEEQIAYEMEMYMKKYSCSLAFDTIVAFGANSSVPHHKTSDKRLTNKDELVLLDFGAKFNGYCADMTRTILTKNAKDKSKKIYQTVLDSQIEAIKYINFSKGKVSGKKAYKAASDYIVKNGFKEIPHGLGHGMGLEVHEFPHLSGKTDDELLPGMVFSIEPGIYIPGFGGVRIEDDFLLTEKGLEPLTTSLK
ncbi:MAG TPA: Xaa-Pro peptidase family protein [Patescibacteria group bacterium]|nr:Xaa-Pro peptidase family protein [Patescibacteria group bacterium]